MRMERGLNMKIKTAALLTATLAGACALLLFPAQAAAGAKNGIGYSVNILVPSLYPFMVLSVFVVKSGLAHKMGRVLEGFTNRVMRLPGSAAATILMSIVGGYPAGARSVAALYEDGAVTEKQAARMLCFCVNAGPSFVITAVGAGLMNSAHAGGILFTAQAAAFFTLALLCGAAGKREKTDPAPLRSPSPPCVSRALIASAKDACRATLDMCCFVILFAALMSLLRMAVRNGFWSAVLSGMLEVTGGCSDLAALGAPLWVYSLVIGWGGVCVHLQILSSVTEIPIGWGRFLFFRLLQGVFSAAYTVLLCRIFPDSVAVFHNTEAPLAAGFAGSAPASAALVALCVVFLMSLPRTRLEMDGAE